MNTKQLEYALTLSAEGSFSKAADKLGISQPSLSQYIKKLEGDLGVELFRRNGQNLTPTQAGAAFLRAAAKISKIEKELQKEIADLQGGVAGSINIGISPFRCAGFMPKVLREFSKRYPAVKVNLYEKTVAELIDNMSREEYDIYVLPLSPDDSKYDYTEITEENFYFLLPIFVTKMASLPVPKVGEIPSVDMKSLEGIPFVSLFENQQIDRELKRLAGLDGAELNIVARCVNIETMYSMAVNGVGGALVPEAVIDSRKKDLRIYKPRNLSTRKIYAATPKSVVPTRAVTELIELMKMIEKER